MEKRGIPNIITCQNRALELPLVSDPGERWEYGNWISIGLGKADERASGQGLGGDLRAEHIFVPSRY